MNVDTLLRKGDRLLLAPQGEALVPTEYGVFRMVAYEDAGGREHLALVKGEVAGEGVLCRVQSECVTGEVFGSRRCECGPQLRAALRLIESAGRGVLVYLRQEGRGIGLGNKLRAYTLQDHGLDTHDANLALGFDADHRRYDLAAAILRDLGVVSVQLLTNNPDKLAQLERNGIVVVRRIAHWVGIHEGNEKYVATKQQRMGHLNRRPV